MAGANSLLTADALYLFGEGTQFRLYRHLGAHFAQRNGQRGVTFGVWAPNAESVSVMGDFNGWDTNSHQLESAGDSGVWQGFIPEVAAGAAYKYHIRSRRGRFRVDKADPLAFRCEEPPRQASIVWGLDYEWGDQAWRDAMSSRQPLRDPMAIYEVHIGSWRRVPEEGNRMLTYRELATSLVDYVLDAGFTHVELLPIMEHPFYGSWGYQTTGYFAPSSRYGTPQDLMYLIDVLHRNGIGVILDWVPSHFPADEHGLVYFDGTHLYEHGDPRKGHHPDWNSAIFNYDRHEVRSFLISSALFWLDEYHADGLRVDAVASMLYLDYSRKPGEWIPNEFGGRENLGAIGFLRRMNEEIYRERPGAVTVAEESTAWPMVSRPTYLGGLGFGMKWDMGWMHDTLDYFSRDPVHRKHHHTNLTFRGLYALSENFLLPLSHDEAVHGKGSLFGKMPGDRWQKFANLRLLFGYQYAVTGKKLLFMGGEFGQVAEWNHDRSLDWHLLNEAMHQGLRRWVRDLNTSYRGQPAFYQLDFDPAGFTWIDCNDAQQSILLMLRRGDPPAPPLVICCNFTPIPRHNYRVGVPHAGYWEEILNSDAPLYGGSGQGNLGGVESVPVGQHGHLNSIIVTLPPLAMIVFKGA